MFCFIFALIKFTKTIIVWVIQYFFLLCCAVLFCYSRKWKGKHLLRKMLFQRDSSLIHRPGMLGAQSFQFFKHVRQWFFKNILLWMGYLSRTSWSNYFSLSKRGHVTWTNLFYDVFVTLNKSPPQKGVVTTAMKNQSTAQDIG